MQRWLLGAQHTLNCRTKTVLLLQAKSRRPKGPLDFEFQIHISLKFKSLQGGSLKLGAQIYIQIVAQFCNAHNFARRYFSNKFFYASPL